MAELEFAPRRVFWIAGTVLWAGGFGIVGWVLLSGQPLVGAPGWLAYLFLTVLLILFGVLLFFSVRAMLTPPLRLTDDGMTIGGAFIPWGQISEFRDVVSNHEYGSSRFVRVIYSPGARLRWDVTVTAALGRMRLYLPPTFVAAKSYRTDEQDLFAVLSEWHNTHR